MHEVSQIQVSGIFLLLWALLTLLLLAWALYERLWKEAEPVEDDFLLHDPRLYPLILEQSGIALYVIDQQGSFLYVNAKACENLGYSSEELLGMTLMQVDSSMDGELWEMLWTMGKRRQEGKAEGLQSMHRRKDGSLFPVQIYAMSFRSGGRDLHISMVLNLQDLHPRKD